MLPASGHTITNELELRAYPSFNGVHDSLRPAAGLGIMTPGVETVEKPTFRPFVGLNPPNELIDFRADKLRRRF